MFGVYVQSLQEKPDALTNLVIPGPFTQGNVENPPLTPQQGDPLLERAGAGLVNC